jgi:hypothetical protein
MDIVDILSEKKDEILSIAKSHGASNVRVFGSVARGENHHDSDIDFLVDMELGRSLIDHASLIFELEKLLKCKVDVVTSRGLRARIRDRVLNEALHL